MGKNQKKDTSIDSTTSKSSNSCSINVVKVKRTRKGVPRDSPSQRSSVYRGVTRHRWTGRYEAHLWDKNSWNESQNKKGKQVYLGAYNDEEAAARAYDLAALKYWGHDTILNFPNKELLQLSMYQEELKKMEGLSKEEYVGSLRRKSSGFSRGVSKYRGVARHHHNGRWEARIGRVFGNKYLYLGTYATQEEAATAYDMAAIGYRGLNAVTNFDVSRYTKWLRPAGTEEGHTAADSSTSTTHSSMPSNLTHDLVPSFQQQQSAGDMSPSPNPRSDHRVAPSSALGLLLHSPKFKEMPEKTPASDCSSPSLQLSSRPSHQCSFPADIQTYFECQDSASYTEGEDYIFGDFSTFMSPTFECELDA